MEGRDRKGYKGKVKEANGPFWQTTICFRLCV